MKIATKCCWWHFASKICTVLFIFTLFWVILIQFLAHASKLSTACCNGEQVTHKHQYKSYADVALSSFCRSNVVFVFLQKSASKSSLQKYSEMLVLQGPWWSRLFGSFYTIVGLLLVIVANPVESWLCLGIQELIVGHTAIMGFVWNIGISFVEN